MEVQAAARLHIRNVDGCHHRHSTGLRSGCWRSNQPLPRQSGSVTGERQEERRLRRREWG
jgi:hypothetical protein